MLSKTLTQQILFSSVQNDPQLMYNLFIFLQFFIFIPSKVIFLLFFSIAVQFACKIEISFGILFQHRLSIPMMGSTFFLVGLLLVTGAINTIQLKLQNIHIVNVSTGEKFFHPFMQTSLLFVGQVVAGFLFYLWECVQGNRAKRLEKQLIGKPQASIFCAFWPAMMDLLSTLLSYLALNMVDSSVWQMSRGGAIVMTALLSRIVLKTHFTTRSIIGCLLALAGITTVQLVTVLTNGNQSTALFHESILGLSLLLLSIFFNSLGLIVQRRVFEKYEIHAFKMVLLQGIFGILQAAPLIYLFQFIPCPWSNKEHCVPVENRYYLENVDKYFSDLANSSRLQVLTIGFICSIAVSVPIGTILSKEVSPVSRSLGNVSRTLLVWMYGIIATILWGKAFPEYRLQSLAFEVNFAKAVGFALLLFGTALYHDKTKNIRVDPVQIQKVGSISRTTAADIGSKQQQKGETNALIEEQKEN